MSFVQIQKGGYMMKYVVKVIDNETGLQVQRSFPHLWVHCESLYFEYLAEFEGCRVEIVPASDADLKAGE